MCPELLNLSQGRQCSFNIWWYSIFSRCAKFRFKPLAEGILMEVNYSSSLSVWSFAVQRIELIMEKENVVVNDEGKKAIILTSEGDLRHTWLIQHFLPIWLKTFVRLTKTTAGKLSLACRAVPGWRGTWRFDRPKREPNLICFPGGARGRVWDIWSDSWAVHWGAPWSLPAQLLWEASGIFSRGH